MAPSAIVALPALAGPGAWMQTMTGFALGLIVMGGIGLTGLVPLPDAAVLVSVLGPVNASRVLARGWHNIAWPEFPRVLVASFLALPLG